MEGVYALPVDREIDNFIKANGVEEFERHMSNCVVGGIDNLEIPVVHGVFRNSVDLYNHVLDIFSGNGLDISELRRNGYLVNITMTPFVPQSDDAFIHHRCVEMSQNRFIMFLVIVDSINISI